MSKAEEKKAAAAAAKAAKAAAKAAKAAAGSLEAPTAGNDHHTSALAAMKKDGIRKG